MVTAYCVKCRKKVEMSNPTLVAFPNGKKAYKGTCPYCGTKVYRFISSK